MRSFDVADLTAPLPQELHDELDWQDEMVAGLDLCHDWIV
jgi:hypothetical protein